jgi:uncharacterized protein involved in exopolysaccharide biosynthesis
MAASKPGPHRAAPLHMSRTSKRAPKATTPSLIRDMLLWTGRAEKRARRYSLMFGLPILLLWSVTGAYVTLAPKSYVSEMTLNLPGATVSSNLSLDSIGQASTSAGNPFSSATMSPKVIYKSIAESARVRGLAAKSMGETSGMIGKPQIKLIDETAIMQFSQTANSPERALAENEALLRAMQEYLDTLRKDEVDRRANAVKESLKDVSLNLSEARNRLLAFQGLAGIASSDQFKIQISNVGVNRQKLVELNAEKQRMTREVSSLSELMNITPSQAALALKIQADPQFASINTEISLALTEDSTNRAKWGSQHPKVVASGTRLKAARLALRKLAAKEAGTYGKSIADNLLLRDSKDRAEVFRKMVEYSASVAGLESQIRSLELELRANASELNGQSVNAAKLEDLERDHKIAEVVFSSALARVDTNRQDIYASYPLLQVLTEPSYPQSPTSPKIMFAIGGAAGGTFLILCALVLAWIRQPILRKILKNA